MQETISNCEAGEVINRNLFIEDEVRFAIIDKTNRWQKK